MDSYYEPPDDPYSHLTDDEYDQMVLAQEAAESSYWDTKIDEARGN